MGYRATNWLRVVVWSAVGVLVALGLFVWLWDVACGSSAIQMAQDDQPIISPTSCVVVWVGF